MRVILRRSKTNQLGAREEVAIGRDQFAATCPVRALEEWEAVLTERMGQPPAGPVFRAIDRHGHLGEGALDGGSVARIIKRAVARAAEAQGSDPKEVQRALERMSGHSLRSGLVTTAFAAGAFAAGAFAEYVMRRTRHRDVKTLVGYRRHATAFVGNVSGRLGL